MKITQLPPYLPDSLVVSIRTVGFYCQTLRLKIDDLKKYAPPGTRYIFSTFAGSLCWSMEPPGIGTDEFEQRFLSFRYDNQGTLIRSNAIFAKHYLKDSEGRHLELDSPHDGPRLLWFASRPDWWNSPRLTELEMRK